MRTPCMQAQVALGNMGLPVLLSVLRDDRDDMDLVHGALESLVAATASHSHGGHGVAPSTAEVGQALPYETLWADGCRRAAGPCGAICMHDYE